MTQKSLVWLFFDKTHKPNTANCKLCKKEYKTAGNTTNLTNHLKRIHLNELPWLKYLCVPATSTDSERVFSSACKIITKKRSQLQPKNVDDLIFMNLNRKFIFNSTNSLTY
jgi:hypothetical protein